MNFELLVNKSYFHILLNRETLVNTHLFAKCLKSIICVNIVDKLTGKIPFPWILLFCTKLNYLASFEVQQLIEIYVVVCQSRLQIIDNIFLVYSENYQNYSGVSWRGFI